MADDWIDPVAASILTAGHKAGLDQNKMKQVTGYAWLVSTNNRLSKMDVNDARREFSKFEIDAQNNLRKYFRDAEYTKEEQGIVRDIAGSVWGGIKGAAGFALDALGNYEQILTSPYRAARLNMTSENFFKNEGWKSGERQFDPEREQRVDQSYTPAVAKIAKRIAMGDKSGQIISDMTTPEEEAAYIAYESGDKVMQNAVRDYNDAKISYGRDWARKIGLNPEIAETDQGLEGKAYKMISGTIDLGVGLITDPAVYLGAALGAAKQARYGVMSMLLADAGSLTRAQKVLSVASKGARRMGLRGAALSFGIDAALELPKVVAAFEKIGPELATIGSKAKGVTVAQKAAAMDRVKTQFPDMTDRAIVYMSQNGIKNSKSWANDPVNTAKEFFRNTEVANDIMQGRVGSMQAMLPTYSISNNARSTVRKATQRILGEKVVAEKIAGFEPAIINSLMNNKSIADQFDLKQLKMRRDRWARIADRAMLRDFVTVEGKGVIDSASDVYAIARVLLPRQQARLVSNAFIIAPDESARRQIVINLFDNIGEFIGANATPDSAKAWKDGLDKIANARYGQDIFVSEKTARALGTKAGIQNPSIVNGRSVASSISQTSVNMSVPRLQDLLKLQDRNFVAATLDNTVNSDLVQYATDLWSALNLLPRLGLRSVLDEGLFTYLTLPVMLFPTLAKGYTAGITGRIVRAPRKRTQIAAPTIDRGGLKFDLGERDLGFGARAMSKFFADVDDATIRAAMSDRKMQGDLWQKQVTESRFGKLFKLSKNYEDDAKYIGDLARYGLTRNLDEFSSGATAGFTNALPSGRLSDDAGEYYNINIDAALEDLGKKFGKEIRDISFTEPEFTVNMLMQLASRVDGNGEIGKIAVRYMERPRKAAMEIKKYLESPEGKKIYSRFDRSRLDGRTVDMDAKDFYLQVRAMFVNNEDELNTALLNKVRRVDDQGNEIINTNSLKVEDLGEKEVADMLPRKTLGYAFKGSAWRSFPELVTAVLDRGFKVADRQLGTLMRTPVYNAYYLYYRRTLKPIEQKFEKDFLSQGLSEKAAKEMASRKFAEHSSDMALNRAIGFIDNPNVRSSFAYGVRNLGRYYRATEDFGRRSMRVLANTPQALIRLRLGSQLLDNAGFIHEDENGDRYFVFPADTIMYGLSAPFVRALTGEWPKQVMPLQITGKLKMLTPSVDLESNIPTFSGPMAAILWSAAAGLLNMTGETGQKITEAADTKLFGKYAENQRLLQMLAPMVGRRVWNIFAVMNNDEQNARFISLAMKSAAYYQANPDYPVISGNSSTSEINMMRYDVRATAFNLLFMQSLLGIWSPVSPQLIEGKDVPDWMRENGVKSIRREFGDILSAEIEKDPIQAYDRAMQKYTKIYPGRLAYTVSETDWKRTGAIKNTQEAIDWINTNTELVKMFPEGSVFLMPQMTGMDLDAYMFLKREGYRESKDLETYFRQIATVDDENTYYDIKETGQKAAAATSDFNQAQRILAESDAKAKAFLEGKDYLRLELEAGRGSKTIMKEMALKDTRQMLSSPLVSDTATVRKLRQMIELYDSAKATLDSVVSQTDASIAYKKTLRSSASQQLQQLAGTDPNAIEFYDTILKRLIEG